MNRMYLAVILVSVFQYFSSCSTVETKPQNLNLTDIKIRSGQSFGFCIGKCYAEMELTNNTALLTIKERQPRGSSSQDVVFTYNETLSASQIQDVASLIDMNTFNKLESVYGCPDCADGGSEWIEIEESKGAIKRVTFEFGKTVPEIEKLIILLRKERNTLIEKYSK